MDSVRLNLSAMVQFTTTLMSHKNYQPNRAKLIYYLTDVKNIRMHRELVLKEVRIKLFLKKYGFGFKKEEVYELLDEKVPKYTYTNLQATYNITTTHSRRPQ